jgi:hypothetical protein
VEVGGGSVHTRHLKQATVSNELGLLAEAPRGAPGRRCTRRCRRWHARVSVLLKAFLTRSSRYNRGQWLGLLLGEALGEHTGRCTGRCAGRWNWALALGQHWEKYWELHWGSGRTGEALEGHHWATLGTHTETLGPALGKTLGAALEQHWEMHSGHRWDWHWARLRDCWVHYSATSSVQPWAMRLGLLLGEALEGAHWVHRRWGGD